MEEVNYMDILTLHRDGNVSITDESCTVGAGTEEDSLDFLEWFTGVRSKEVFNESFVFNNDGVLVRLVKE